jgi:hypothetical protein
MVCIKSREKSFRHGPCRIVASLGKVLWVCFSGITGYAAYNNMQCCLFLDFVGHLHPEIAIEACLVWFLMVLGQSVYLYPYATIIVILQGALVAIGLFNLSLFDRNKESFYRQTSQMISHQHNNQQSPRLHYLTLYRSALLYLTIIAILAVDFPKLFPRRLCKTEEEGYGLMDVGAASFCISAGLVGPKRRSNHTSTSPWKPLLHTLPLVVIGIVRILTNQ